MSTPSTRRLDPRAWLASWAIAGALAACGDPVEATPEIEAAALAADSGPGAALDAHTGPDVADPDLGAGTAEDAARPMADAPAGPDDSTADAHAPSDAAPAPDTAADTAAAADTAPTPDATADLPPEIKPLASIGCGKPLAPGVYPGKLGAGLSERKWQLVVPPGYQPDQPAPLVLAFHGLLDDMAKMRALTGLDATAAQHGALVVYPQGAGNSWNAGACCAPANFSGVDDVGFVLDLLDLVGAQACVDPKRVYSTGFSNGGFLSHRLACQASHRIAAIAPVSGSMPSGLSPCKPPRPVPVFQIHGTGDLVEPYAGSLFGIWSVDATLQHWRDHAGCPKTGQQVYAQGDVTCTAWGPCQQGSEVRLCKVDGGGHQWPGSPEPALPGFGKKSEHLDASAAILQFFLAHPMP